MLDQNDVHRLFQDAWSVTSSYDRDKNVRILNAVRQQLGLAPSEVLAVSSNYQSLFVICNAGVVTASEKGMFGKRIEVGELIRYGEIQHLLQKPDGRFGSMIEVVGHGPTRLQLKWGAGGPIEPEDAASERDRIFNIMVRAHAAA